MTAVTDAVPAIGDVSVTVAKPLESVRTVPVCDNVPKVVVKVTHTPVQAAGCPPLVKSCTEIVEAVEAGRLVGLAVRMDLEILNWLQAACADASATEKK